MISNGFWHENGEIAEICAYWHFTSKTGRQKYRACVPKHQVSRFFGKLESLLKKHQNFMNLTVYILVFSLLNKYTSFIYDREK